VARPPGGTPFTTRTDHDFDNGENGTHPTKIDFGGRAFTHDPNLEAFTFAANHDDCCISDDDVDSNNRQRWIEPTVVSSETDHVVVAMVPLAPCVYRITDYTLAKREPVRVDRCVNKLGV
jgi:hypothetical protein